VKRQLEFDKEYLEYFSLKDIFPFYGTGIQTSRDGFATDADRDVLVDRLRTFFDLRHSDARIAEIFGLSDTRGWKIKQVRRSTNLNEILGTITQCAFRPFDKRWIPLTKDVVDCHDLRSCPALQGDGRGFSAAASSQHQDFVTRW
jgi:hypothetical protein